MFISLISILKMKNKREEKKRTIPKSNCFCFVCEFVIISYRNCGIEYELHISSLKSLENATACFKYKFLYKFYVDECKARIPIHRSRKERKNNNEKKNIQSIRKLNRHTNPNKQITKSKEKSSAY